MSYDENRISDLIDGGIHQQKDKIKSDNIKRFCELVPQINALHVYLQKESENFYDGGYSFEDCFADDYKNLSNLNNEFDAALIEIMKK